MRRTEMDNIIENMAEYICDHICQKPKEITDAEKTGRLLCRRMRYRKPYL